MRSPAHPDDPCPSTPSASIMRPHRSTCASRSHFRRTRSGMRCATSCAARRSRKRRSCRPATAPSSTCTAPSRAGRHLARGFPPRAEGLAFAVYLHAAARQGGDACVPRGLRPRFDGAGRAADPGPDEAGRAARRIGGHAGARAESPLPAHVRRGQGRAHANRHRQRVDLDGGRVGQARRADLSRRSPSSGCC